MGGEKREKERGEERKEEREGRRKKGRKRRRKKAGDEALPRWVDLIGGSQGQVVAHWTEAGKKRRGLSIRCAAAGPFADWLSTPEPSLLSLVLSLYLPSISHGGES